MAILITGGLGYIGSNISKILKDEAIIIDNQSNSKLDFKKYLPHAKVYLGDICKKTLDPIFKSNNIESVIHLAGYKSVNESVINPIKYYKNNIQSSIDLIDLMIKYNVNKLVFSSSATVYDKNEKSPLNENSNTDPENPYGQTKLIIEKLILDCCNSYNNFSSIILRYFNPIGADEYGHFGDHPKLTPQNIMPLLNDSIKNNYKFKIFGNNYDTRDGTCLRDYIHVIDLAQSHISSIELFKKNINFEIINIGLGKGISVFELIKCFENINNLKINLEIFERRKGDIPICYADNTKALKILNWTPKYTYEDMCKHAYLSLKYV